MLVLIRGAGDLASGIALRLWRSRYEVVMTDLPMPTTIRRTVAFSEAVRHGTARVENVEAWRADTASEARDLLARRIIPVLADPECACREELEPDALVDAILAKRNLGTAVTDAPVVIGVGPGFTAGEDCHAVVETMRGHTLGRAIYHGSALPNTNVPGLIGGFAGERVLRAPAGGVFYGVRRIGDRVKAGDVVGCVKGKAGDIAGCVEEKAGDMAGCVKEKASKPEEAAGGETETGGKSEETELPMTATLDGVLRGLLADGTAVRAGMKAGDVDPRGDPSFCTLVSDKALAIGGGVLEALLRLGVLPG